MYTIELTLKNNPIALSIQKKDPETAHQVYTDIVQAMTTHPPKILELTCDKQEGKKLAVLSSELSAVQIAEKAGATTNTGAGFVRM
ncbi:MAG: hypothetical protein ACK4QL_04080 [Pseudanabaenaceae cyanobacterium]